MSSRFRGNIREMSVWLFYLLNRHLKYWQIEIYQCTHWPLSYFVVACCYLQTESREALCIIHDTLQIYEPQNITSWVISYRVRCNTLCSKPRHPRWQGSWGLHGAHLGTTGPRWAPCWPHEPCYQGCYHIVELSWYQLICSRTGCRWYCKAHI